MAIDAPPAFYVWQVGAALDAGATPRDILGILTAVAPQVGLARVVAAAPEIMVALDLELPDGLDGRPERLTGGGIPGSPGGPGRRGPLTGRPADYRICRRTPRSTASRREDTPSL